MCLENAVEHLHSLAIYVGMHKAVSDGCVKLDGSLSQHCLEKEALNVYDDVEPVG